ncbi:hypothetical protein SNEBB_008409 [Seison nebaliae]|nr:hypothetical protein SNEBB_008409 [Seison nebaliae]
MRLITHNLLTSKVIENVKTGFPLHLQVKQYEWLQINFNLNFILKFLPRINWPVFCQALEQCEGIDYIFPSEFDPLEASKWDISLHSQNEDDLDDDDGNNKDKMMILRKIHHFLFEYEILEGILTCPESKRKFLIQNGIPKMDCPLPE